MSAALDGIRVLDLTRVLAGPFCTQLLGDLGAEVIKVERPDVGDDTRKWGPPYLPDGDGENTAESAYYAAANRNKKSVAIDISTSEGQTLIHQLLAKSDILVENYKVGNLAKYGLAYEQIKDRYPGLIYCSVTGFGQTGPYKHRSGYDFLAQGMGGMMSLTGEPDGEPVKVGIGNTDLVAGMYATVGILAALRHKERTGEGQQVDVGLLDVQTAWLTYEGSNYLVSGKEPIRRGNAHPNIVPYETFHAADGVVILAVGNDSQFRKFCQFAEKPEWADDPDYATNPARVKNRVTLIAMIRDVIAQHPRDHWVDGLERLGVPSSPVNTVTDVFNDKHVKARGMVVRLTNPATGGVAPLIANPLKLSKTPPSYRHAPPALGEQTAEVLRAVLGINAVVDVGSR